MQQLGYLWLRLITQEQNGARPYIYPGIFILSLSLKMSFMYGNNYGLTITNTIMYGSLSGSVAWVIFKFVGKKNKQVERMRGILELVPNGIIYVSCYIGSSIRKLFFPVNTLSDSRIFETLVAQRYDLCMSFKKNDLKSKVDNITPSRVNCLFSASIRIMQLKYYFKYLL